jgi:hypothetical protein
VFRETGGPRKSSTSRRRRVGWEDFKIVVYPGEDTESVGVGFSAGIVLPCPGGGKGKGGQGEVHHEVTKDAKVRKGLSHAEHAESAESECRG